MNASIAAAIHDLHTHEGAALRHLIGGMPFQDPGSSWTGVKWELAMVAATLLVVAGVSGRLTDTSFTPAMAFVLTGLVIGPLVIDQVTLAATSATVRTLAEATLAVVLFADA